MELLNNPIQYYDWGSRYTLAALQGRPQPSERPEAELWIGAHCAAPSTLLRNGQIRSFPQVIAAGPEHELGRQQLDTFGPRLPYLCKLLVAERPLSIQVHPSSDQAEAGFAAERAAGLDLADPQRNYRDPYHKPELLCAVTEFEGLYGFRPVAQAAAVLRELRVPMLNEYADRLLRQPEGLRAVFTELVTGAAPTGVVPATAAALRRAAPRSGKFTNDYAACAAIADLYPDDVGVVLALLLNYLRLAPGDAVYVHAGMPHAHVRGFGVEVMASSDNVVRCGLTGKHIDIAELLKLTSWQPECVAPLPPIELAPKMLRWLVPAAEFMLTRLELSAADKPTMLDDPGPRVVLCLSGQVQAAGGRAPVILNAGQAAYCSAGDGPIILSGAGSAFVVSVSAAVG
ncbi:MAG: mannose-6-phosphate isomerase, class I [Acidimicrobiales bacterium]|nr:MAG: mannose-6-phosphate isomerase, class I [Acidimicrobiales bacterium]